MLDCFLVCLLVCLFACFCLLALLACLFVLLVSWLVVGLQQGSAVHCSVQMVSGHFGEEVAQLMKLHT